MSSKIEVVQEIPLTHPDLGRRIDALPPHKRREALRAANHIYNKRAAVWRTPAADELEAKGWEPWLTTLAPHVFHSQFEDFDRKFWDWYWLLLTTKQEGKRLVDLDIELAYLNTLARGLGKSSALEWAFIALGARLGKVLGVYISSTSGLAEGHLNNIRDELESSLIEEYYPGLANPDVGKFGNRYGWTAALLATASGLTIFAAGLQEEIRGLKRRNLRPALVGLDEFDSKNDSPDIVAKKESIIGGSIFGTQTVETIIVMSQNIIHSRSVADRTQKRTNELLSYRRESGLVRAFSNDLEIEMVGTRWFATKGTPLYARLDMAAFQKFLDTSGPIETYAEYQHRFDLDLEGKVFKNYNDLIHVITEEDFARVYDTKRVPATWWKFLAHDKARTKTEFHANVACTVSMSSQNSPLPGISFMYDCLSFPAATEPEDCAVEMLKCMTPTITIQGVTYTWDDLVKTLISRNQIARFTKTRRDEIAAQREGLAQVIPEHVHPLLVALNYQKFRMSHEADDWRTVYRDAFGLPFSAANPGHNGGTAMINLIAKVDPNVPDPFGRRAHDEQGHDIGPLMGMSRFYIIVKKDKLPYPNDAKPDLLHGTDLARYQFTEQRYLDTKVTKDGEKEGEPEKRNDDYFNCLQMLYFDHSVQARELTAGEMQDATLPVPMQAAVIAAETNPEKKASNVMAREIALKRQAAAEVTSQLAGGGRSRNRLSAYRKLQRKGV